jgi:hypothetical protein
MLDEVILSSGFAAEKYLVDMKLCVGSGVFVSAGGDLAGCFLVGDYLLGGFGMVRFCWWRVGFFRRPV